MRKRVGIVAVVASVSGVAMWALGGPLNPPPGPVAPSYKTLTEVEPRVQLSASTTPDTSTCVFHITQPGSYYLLGSVTAAANQSAICVSAPDVTIDLMGFTLHGGPHTVSGVFVDGLDTSNLTIRNGVVAGFGAAGLDVERIPGAISRIERRRAGRTGRRPREGSGTAERKDAHHLTSNVGTRSCGRGARAWPSWQVTVSGAGHLLDE